MLHTLFRPFFVLILLSGQLSPRQSMAPGNDNFTNAMLITALPFSTELDVSEATLEPDEPQTCLPTDRSVWYTFNPSAAMILIADTLASSATKISIFRATGPGIADLESVQCVSSGGAITFAVEPGQTYYFQVGALVGEAGAINFSLSELTAITGRVTDAVTGLPLPGDSPPFALVSLLWVCGADCLALISSLPASGDGRFRFDNYSGYLGGTYLIEVSAGAYETKRFGPFEFSGTNLEVGDLAIVPLPRIGSINGRLVDAVTGRPISENFPSFVQLFRCTDGNCFELVNSQVPDSRAEFRFESDAQGNPLTVGTYQIWASAEQYQQKIADPFSVGEGMHQTMGDISLISFPVRFSDVQPCADVPASGGECVFSVRIWNGGATRFRGKAWSLVNASLPESSVGASDFQVKNPKDLELDRGKSRVLRFRLSVPGSSSPAEAFICTRVFVGQGKNFLFNTVGFRELFCILRNAQGISIASPKEAVAPEQTAVAAATGTETEPNNSCQTAQDVGAVPIPFVLDGNLDSILEPDIDFYRFSGTPSVLLGIDQEGEPTGKGTLADPLLAFFDSSCNLLAVNNDTNSANARIEIPIPADGVFILGATAYPDFGLTGGGNGSYQLTLAPIPLIGSIRGRITDIFGNPLRGDVEPFAFIRLLQCGDEFGCIDVNAQAADSEGRFVFETDLQGAPLRAGNYQLIVTGNQYRESQSEQFAVGEAAQHDVGDFILESFAVRFSDIQPCALPADGGTCNFSVKITNGLSTRLSGKAWSMINSAWIGSFTDISAFQTGGLRAVKLDPGKGTTLRFRFRVPDSVADGATICASVYVGKNPSAYFNPVGNTLLFCFTKGASGLTLMSGQDAQAASQQMQIRKLAPSDLFTDKK